ncbi:hypothetical protein C8R43DRAFT_1140773 [Mycena crocata]|nr:hypothetical protein C8R43DRAFT_1140773 [Mycena crocata]
MSVATIQCPAQFVGCSAHTATAEDKGLGLWFMTDSGLISRDADRIMEWQHCDTEDDAGDPCDHPTYTATTFRNVVRFLPRLANFSEAFIREPGGARKQVEEIYYAVEGTTDAVFNTIAQVEKAYEAGLQYEAGWYACIQATTSLEEAWRVAKSNFALEQPVLSDM